MKPKKQLIFFDADGTLWYPKKTKYSEKPWWIYEHPETKDDDPRKHLMLMPNVKKALRRLDRMGFSLVLISQVPYARKKSTLILKNITKHLGIYDFFDEIRPSFSSIRKGYADPKEIAMAEIIRKRGIPKSRALMVGDSYRYDYLPAKKCGIDCVMIEGFRHTKGDWRRNRLHKRIKTLDKLVGFLH